MNETQPQMVTITPEQLRFMKKELKQMIAKGEALARLNSNKDFKFLFKEVYENEEAIRLVHLLADSRFNEDANKDKHREDFRERMMGIARFAEFCRITEQRADRAVYELQELENIDYEIVEQ